MNVAEDRTVRIRTAVTLLAVIAVGLLARSFRDGADPGTLFGFLATYLGDVLWPIMFFLIGRLLFPKVSTWKLLLGTLALTLSIEFAQLWHPPFLEWLRAKTITGFLLGHTFLWSDVVCLFVGSGLAGAWNSVLVARVPSTRT